MAKEIITGWNNEREKPIGHCAVVGMIDFLDRDVSSMVILGLESLQHRAQDGAGLAAFRPGTKDSAFKLHKRLGLVKDVFFKDAMDPNELSSFLAIGHTRYATAGSKGIDACLQPFVVGGLALAHNGNIINVESLREMLSPYKPAFQADSDSEILAHLITVMPGNDWPEKIENALHLVKGSYSLVMATSEGQLIAARDPLSVRPLWVGYNSQSVIFASETIAFQRIPVHMQEEIKGGEMVVVNRSGIIQKKVIFPGKSSAECLAERIYIGHVMSRYDGKELKQTREKMGENLAKEHPMPEVDIICGVPDSALPVAVGYARALGQDVNQVVIKDRYSAGIRTFIQGTRAARIEALEAKFFISGEVEGKSVLLIDDSSIRGATMEILIKKLRQRGAREIHVRVASPKFVDICDLGTDIATKEELVAVKLDENGWYQELGDMDVAERIGATSVGFLSLKGLVNATGRKIEDFCTHCWTHQHPIWDQQPDEKGQPSLQELNARATIYSSL